MVSEAVPVFSRSWGIKERDTERDREGGGERGRETHTQRGRDRDREFEGAIIWSNKKIQNIYLDGA